MKKIFRTTKDQKLGGVIGGFGEYFDIDPNILRLLTILVCIASGFFPVIITYIVAWIILPEEPAGEKDGTNIDETQITQQAGNL